MRIKSGQKYAFSNVPGPQIQRSSFRRSFTHKTTFDSGFLIPVYIDEVLPGDTFNVRMTAFARLATPIFPVMDNLYLDSQFFFVPNRLLWSNWEKQHGEQVNPGDSIDYLTPIMTSTAVTGYAVGSLHDYFGIPTGIPGLEHISLWHRAYNLIWNEWFRDQNLQNSVPVPLTDGPDTPTDFVLLRRGKRHDYFTSCIPFPQKGVSVPLPLGTTAKVTALATEHTTGASPGVKGRFAAAGTLPGSNAFVGLNTTGGVNAGGSFGSTGPDMYFSNLYADLSTATAATINQLRQSFQIQRFLERDARGGTRYIELIKSHFGVTSSDARLQRPEYLGGGSTPVNITPIAQTAATAAGTTPQGNLAAIGTIVATNGRHGFVKSFEEHGVIIGLVSVRADLTYQQGLHRMFSRRTRYDFYDPAFAHLGEQAVLNKEIYAVGSVNPTQDAAVFGYQERFAEYRYASSKITGQFRSTFATSLDAWHLAQRFTTLPTLGTTFIQETPPVSRVLAVTTAPQFLFDSYFEQTCARPMPVYSVPGLIDHF